MAPRILPVTISNLLDSVPGRIAKPLEEWISKKGSVKGVTAASASILGKNYRKQVDVVMTDWHTGPELLISTKRMDSSYGNNAANRVEESYGDAKNLRLRHPMAALGFVFGLRSDILQSAPDVAEWLMDLLAKLGREDDAYHATCLVLIEYGADAAVPEDDGTDTEDRLAAAGIDSDEEDEPSEEELELSAVEQEEIEHVLANLPAVAIRRDATPENLAPERFLAAMVSRVLDVTPVNMHSEARARRKDAIDLPA